MSRRAWMLALAALVFFHGIFLYTVSSHLAATVGVASGLVLLIAIKHVGLLGPLYAILRRRLRR